MCRRLVAVIMGVHGEADRLDRPEDKHANGRGHEETAPPNALAQESGKESDEEIVDVEQTILCPDFQN